MHNENKKSRKEKEALKVCVGAGGGYQIKKTVPEKQEKKE